MKYRLSYSICELGNCYTQSQDIEEDCVIHAMDKAVKIMDELRAIGHTVHYISMEKLI